jgi:hypothetical protein
MDVAPAEAGIHGRNDGKKAAFIQYVIMDAWNRLNSPSMRHPWAGSRF